MINDRPLRDGVATGNAAVPYRGRADVRITTNEGRDGAPRQYFLKLGGQIYEFGDEEHFLFRMLDGERSFEQIAAAFRARFHYGLPQLQFNNFLRELATLDLIESSAQLDAATDIDAAEPMPQAQLHVVLVDEAAAAEPSATAEELPQEGIAAGQRVLHLVNPARLLAALAWLGTPLRYYLWMLVPAVGIVGSSMFAHEFDLRTDLLALHPLAAFGLAVIAAVLVALIARLAQAAVAVAFGATVHGMGIALSRDVIPVLVAYPAQLQRLSWRGQLLTHAAPLMAQLATFAVATQLWLAFRGSAAPWPALGLLTGQFAFWGFCITAMPVVPSFGQRWLATYFGQPDLGRRIMRLPLRAQSPAGLPPLGGLGKRGVAYAAAGSLIAIAILLSSALLYAEVGLFPGLAGSAFTVFVLAAVLASLWLVGVRRQLDRARIAGRRVAPVSSPDASAPAAFGRVVPFAREGAPLNAIAPADRPGQVGEIWPTTTPVVVLAALAAALISVSFVPYPYEAGGSFTILPNDSSQLPARLSGELTEVFVDEGDTVEPGQVLATLSDWDQKYNLAVAKAQLESAQANLQNLLHNPQPEQIELARQQYLLAVSKIPYAKAQFQRYETLVKTQSASQTQYDQAESQYEQAKVAAEVARANYDLVRIGPTQDQIEAARAQVRQATAAVAYNEDQLERTRIRASTHGRVVTPNPMLLRGQWFNQGTTVLTVEDHSVVQADIQVPETDIGHVRSEGTVRARPWGYARDTFPGRVIAIAPDAQTPSGGGTNYIRVRAELPNPDGRLHPNMDGYAKLTGLYMPTWNAFDLLFERFFLVEVWSWIP